MSSSPSVSSGSSDKADPRLRKDLYIVSQLVERLSYAAYRIRNARKRIAGEDMDPPSDAPDLKPPFGIAPELEYHLTTLDNISDTLEADADMLESLV